MKNINSYILIILLSTLGAQTITVQGVLRDNNNAAISDGTYTMSFEIFDSQSGGTSLWPTEPEEQDVTVINGVYSLGLNIGTSLQSSGSELWLEVTVNGEPMNERVRLHISPYEQIIMENQSNVFPVSGNVGIGTGGTIPSSPLTVEGNITSTGNIAAESISANSVNFNNSLTANDLASGSVGTSEIAADAVDDTKIANESISSEHYIDGSVHNAHIGDDQVNSEHYADGSIDSEHLADIVELNIGQYNSNNLTDETLIPGKITFGTGYSPAIWSEYPPGYTDGIDLHLGASSTNNAITKSYFSIYGKGGKIGMDGGFEPGTDADFYKFYTPNPGWMRVNINNRFGFGYDDEDNTMYIRTPNPDGAHLYFYGENQEYTANQYNQMIAELKTVSLNADSYDEYGRQTENTRPISYGLNTIMNLSPKIYNYTIDSRDRIGFIPEEVEEFIPEIITPPGEGIDLYTINYSGFTPVLTKAMQELKIEKDVEIDELKRTIGQLTKRIEELENK